MIARLVSKFRRHAIIQTDHLSIVVFCRNSMCTNLPITDIGGPCESDMDCEGFDYALYAPVYCGMDNRCGGTNATCQAQDGGVNGNSYDCVSRKSGCPFHDQRMTLMPLLSSLFRTMLQRSMHDCTSSATQRRNMRSRYRRMFRTRRLL